MGMTKAYTTDIAATVKVSNILADTELDTCPMPGGHYYIFGRHDRTTYLEAELQLNARVAGSLKGEDLPVNVGVGGPKKPDDHILTLDAAGGDSILISLTETGGSGCAAPSIRGEFEELTPQELAAIKQALGGGRRAVGYRRGGLR